MTLNSDAGEKRSDLGWKKRPAFPEFAKNDNDEPNDDLAERKPWDAMRFFQQSSKFVQFPNPFQQSIPRVVGPGDIIWSSDSPSPDFVFSPLDDVVMGGASESTFDAQTGIWRGSVTAANNGGFAGIRSTGFSSLLDMSTCNGIELKLNGGNGKRFKFIVRDSTDFNGVCWTTSFDASIKNPLLTLLDQDDSFVVRVPFKTQVPLIFARTVPDQVFDSSNVAGFQLAYSKFEYDGELNSNFELGDFSLQIKEVRGY